MIPHGQIIVILIPVKFELKPFRIGQIVVKHPVVLAPLAGYSDLPFRLLCRRFGAAYCTTEMMLDRMVLVCGKLHHRMMAMTDDDHPLAGQLIGNDPAEMARAAEELCRHGFDVIDLNFACPVHKALSRRRGGHLMGSPKIVNQIVDAVVAAADRPVTIKVRQKLKSADADDSFWEIAEHAFAAGAAAITVHARSVEAKYSGQADWDFLAAVKQRFADRTVIGSGDVTCPKKAVELLMHAKLDGVAAARGALGNPWFFRQVCDVAAGDAPYHPSLAEQRAILLEHFQGACDLYGSQGPKIMRKVGIRYARLHPTPTKIRMAFVEVKNAAQWHDVLERHYDDGVLQASCT